MDHQAIKDMLFALHDGELDAASRKEVEAHLTGCLECRQTQQQWARTAKAFFQAPKPASSEFFVRSVMNRIHELEAPKSAVSWRISMPWLVPAVGLAFVFVLAFFPSPPSITMDSLLFQETGGRPGWALSNNLSSADETLQFVMEDSL